MHTAGSESRREQAAAALVTGLLALASLVLAAAPARAHGPTVEITAAGLKPSLLNLFEGTTVHFANTLEAPEGLVVVDETGVIESPRLRVPGDGWHYTFEQAGTWVIFVEQRPDAKMRIVVVPKRAP